MTMDTMSPEEEQRQDQRIAWVFDQVTDRLTSAHLARLLGVDDADEREMDFMDQARDIIMDNLDVDDTIRAVCLLLWGRASTMALHAIRQIPKEGT